MVRTAMAQCQYSSPCVPPVITFGGVAATDVGVIDRETFRATTPPHAAGAVEVRVKGQRDLSSFAFRYYDPAEPPLEAFFERVLIPILYDGPGRYGSQWQTDLSVRNANDFVVQPWVVNGEQLTFQPGRPKRVSIEPAPEGRFLLLPREALPRLHYNLLVRDVSEGRGWGTEVPMVRETEFRQSIELMNLPFDQRYRVTLRLYSTQPASAGVLVWTMIGPGPGPHGRSVELTCGGSPACPADRPAHGALDLSPPAGLAAGGSFSIRVNSPRPVWGFATVTDNETQHVTVISAQ
jgi:hypothetical protein